MRFKEGLNITSDAGQYNLLKHSKNKEKVLDIGAGISTLSFLLLIILIFLFNGSTKEV